MKDRHTLKVPKSDKWMHPFPGARPFLPSAPSWIRMPAAVWKSYALLSVFLAWPVPGQPVGAQDLSVLSRGDAWQLSARRIEYGRISHILSPPGRENSRSLSFFARGDGMFRLRLGKPLRLTGYVTQLQVLALGPGSGESLFAVFQDRLGRYVRLQAGRIDQPGWQSLTIRTAGRLHHRPRRISEEAWVTFLGWDVEASGPGNAPGGVTTWLLLAEPTFQIEPYRADPPGPQ